MEYDISDMDDPSVGYPYSWRSSFHTGCHCNPKKTLPRQNPRHVAHVRLGGEEGEKRIDPSRDGDRVGTSSKRVIENSVMLHLRLEVIFCVVHSGCGVMRFSRSTGARRCLRSRLNARERGINWIPSCSE